MTFAPTSSLAFQIPENISFSEDNKQFLAQMTEIYQKIARASNAKDTAIYDEVEILTGQLFFGANPQVKRQAYRRVYDFGVLPNNATKSLAHGLTDFANITFTRIYATATDPGTAAISIPFVNTVIPGDSVQLNVTNVNIDVTTTTANYTGYTECIVILEYLKN